MHFDELEITLGHEIEIEMARLDDVVDEAMDHRRLELQADCRHRQLGMPVVLGESDVYDQDVTSPST